jgi:hypothetical protein
MSAPLDRYDADPIVTVPAPRTTRRHALAMIAAAPLALAALPAVLEAAPASTTVDTTPSAWSEPSPLVSDLVGAHLRAVSDLIAEIEAGRPASEAGPRFLERADVIYAELAAPHGEAGKVAWRESIERFADGWRIICEHFGLDAA